MAREGTKTAKAIAVMVANKDKSMEEVLPLIAKATNHDLPHAKNYYVWCVKKGLAPGNIATKAKKAKTKAVPAEKLLKELNLKPKASKNEAAEALKDIEAIKAKNLQTLRNVSKGQAKIRKEFDDNEAAIAEEDPRSYVPKFLHKELGLL
jgi:hypothetical protein